MGFEQWWHKHGSGVRPTEGCDCEEHGRRVAALAWNEATAAEKERCARIAEGVERTEDRHWIPGSLYDTLRRETAAEIRREVSVREPGEHLDPSTIDVLFPIINCEGGQNESN